jgi:hypothetical protein
MPLTSKQRAALEAKAKEHGVDPARLIAEAEALSDPAAPGTKQKSSGEQPKLYMYLLPFVRVREVREVWLGLGESFPGDEEVASEWAAKHGGESGSTDDGQT